MHGMCDKCGKLCAWVWLILGVLLLARDFGMNYLGGVQWYSAVILLWGLGMVAKGQCKMCK
ncbi:MAG: hypothetical protein ACE5FT_05790 [Candidatus Nanoarchaeia archaeon]